MNAVVISVSMVSAAAFSSRICWFSASMSSIFMIARLSPVARTLSLYIFSRFRTLRSCILRMNVNGILYVWSRKMVFFFINVDASFSLTSISREPTVVSLIQKLSMIPPFSPRDILLYMYPACMRYLRPM